jgi:hypothetical protein
MKKHGAGQGVVAQRHPTGRHAVSDGWSRR